MNLKNYDLELEKNSIKARTGVFIKQSVNYKRKLDLEGVNSHLVIIDIASNMPIKITTC